ncbi:hypothetical protein [Nocardia sp. NPDC051570]|uniref:hypothetical protein n=1 Tax=Nocardia sp. NPDC051570 TaxID=3364324 RepID=UPI00379E5E9A
MSVTFYVAGQHGDPRVADLEVNVHDGNAADLLVLLGYRRPAGAAVPRPQEPAEMTGEAQAENFLGRVLIAAALYPDNAAQPARSPIRVTARREGHVAMRLRNLERLARYCLDIEADIAWA